MQDPQEQRTEQGDRRGVEVEPADAPHAQQRGKIEQS
jgi:hypothetical protein